MDSEQEKTENRGAPTKYREDYPKKAYKLALLGATESQMADFFEVVQSTITLWKTEHPEFSASIKAGKIDADATIAQSLFKRAKGYKYEERTFEETTITSVNEAGELNIQPATLIKIVKKQQAPDTAAAIIWLKNRQSLLWRDRQFLDIESGGVPLTIVVRPKEALKLPIPKTIELNGNGHNGHT